MDEKILNRIKSIIKFDDSKHYKQSGTSNTGFACDPIQLSDHLSVFPKIDFAEVAKMNDKEIENFNQNDYRVTISYILILTLENSGSGIVFRNDKVYHYNGMFWDEVKISEFKPFLREIAILSGAPRLMVMNYKFLEELFKQFISISIFYDSYIDDDNVKINLKNGTLVIDKGGKVTLKPFDKKDFMTYQLSFEYNPLAVSPIFDKYLNQTLPDHRF